MGMGGRGHPHITSVIQGLSDCGPSSQDRPCSVLSELPFRQHSNTHPWGWGAETLLVSRLPSYNGPAEHLSLPCLRLLQLPPALPMLLQQEGQGQVP